MKKNITALTLIILSSQFFTVLGQKTNRLPQKNIKSAEVPAAKNTEAPGIKTAEAFSDGNGVLLKWNTGSETDLLGFNIYRVDGKGNVKLNKSLILSTNLRNKPAAEAGSEYNFFDEDGAYQNSYLVETVFVGRKTMFNPIVPQYTSDLKNVSDFSSQEFRRTKEAAQPVIETSAPFLKNNSKLKSANTQNLVDPVNQRWVASQPGVKLTITKEGFYRVSRAQLEAAGFNVSAAVSLWQLYFNGEEQAIIADPSGQYIEFYGAPVEDGVEAATATYYLLVGSANGRRMDSRVVRPVGGTIPATTFYQSQILKQRASYIPTLLNGDDNNFYGDFIGTDPINVSFNVRAIDYSIRKTEMYVTVQGISLFSHTTQITVNGNDMGTVSGSNRDSMQAYITIPTQYLNEGANTLTLNALDGDNDYSLFDSVEVRVQRKYVADDNQLSFYTNDFRSSDLYGFTSSGIRLFDVTNNGRPTVLSGATIFQQNGVYVVSIPAYQTRKMYALTNDALQQVPSITPNVPSTISTLAHSTQLVIISHKNFMTGANAWANYRRSQGMTVEVFDVEDIYDEFNYGKLSYHAIKNFVDYAKNQWTTPPGYIMLVGDATYDPRDYYGIGDFNFVPTQMADTVYSEAGSDDAMMDLNDDGLAEIPIGRLPVRTSAEVTHLLNKTTTFELTFTNGFNRGALCATDAPIGYDFVSLCNRVLSELPSSVTRSYVTRPDANSNATLLGYLNAGKYIVNYSGHGSPTFWGSNGFFNSNHALALTNGDNLSIFTMLTCLSGNFVEPATPSLSERLLQSQNGGAVITWSSSGLTTPDIQEVMARRFYNQLGYGTMTRMGDLVNDAKSALNGGRDVRLSWVLLGDPTLKVK